MRRTIIAALALSLATPLAAPAHAGPQAEALVAGAAEELVSGQFTGRELAELIDTRRIARFTLGRHARTLPASEVARYEAAFETFLETTFEAHAERFLAAEVQVLGSVDRNARDSIVTTRVRVPGEGSETVRWRVIERDGVWRVVDVEAFGLWLAIEQRAQIAAILDQRRGNIDEVIAALGDWPRQYADAGS